MKKAFFLILSLFLATTFVACTTPKPEVTQVNTINSLLAGVYDGTMSLGELKTYGDFGIGTFDKLDGEMLLLNGTVYQIKGDGTVYTPANDVTTPFASVVKFAPQTTFSTQNKSYTELCALLDSVAPNQNIFTAVMLTGEFEYMHTRSVPAQEKPYRPLVEVTKNQPEFTMNNVRGTVVGFRLPQYVSGVNVPGYHLHFVSDDKQCGGHILDFKLALAEAKIQNIYRFSMLLPEGSDDFAKVDLGKDRSEELHKVESKK